MMKKKTKLNFTILFMIILVILNVFVFNITFVLGDSMEPTFHSGDILFTSKIYSEINKNDIIITSHNNALNAPLIKRVIGTQGNKITIEDNRVYVDDKELIYYSEFQSEESLSIIVPAESYFILGDNYRYSKDSRNIGTIETDDVNGKIMFKIFSPKKFWDAFTIYFFKGV